MPNTSGSKRTKAQAAAGPDSILARLQELNPHLVRNWFSKLKLGPLASGRIEIWGANSAQVHYLEEKCKSAFAEAAQAVTGRLVTVAFKFPENAGDECAVDQRDSSSAMNRLDPAFTLQWFAVGPCNRLAHSAALAVAEQPGEAYNPLFVCGAAGLGKTHLLQGIVCAAAGREIAGGCVYAPCGSFVAAAIRDMEQEGSNHLEPYQAARVLAVDDVHLLAGRERSQEAFFHLLNDMSARGRQLVVSGDCLPSEIHGLHERLASRLGAGLVVALDAPCLETRMAIVREKASLLALDMSEEIVRTIAERADGNARQLTDAIARIDALSTFESSPITIDLVARSFDQNCAASTTRTGRPHAVR